MLKQIGFLLQFSHGSDINSISYPYLIMFKMNLSLVKLVQLWKKCDIFPAAKFPDIGN